MCYDSRKGSFFRHRLIISFAYVYITDTKIARIIKSFDPKENRFKYVSNNNKNNKKENSVA